MKPVSEMNGTERAAYRAVKSIFDWYAGEWYNAYSDGMGSDIPAMRDARKIIYQESMESSAMPGLYQAGRAEKNIRFAGSAFIESVIDHLFSVDGDIREMIGAGYLK